MHLKNGDYTTIVNIENFPKYQKVYNFDIADNENYYVTEDVILVHNGYKAQVKEVDELTHDLELTISKSDYPETAQHIEDAIANGHPGTVEIQKSFAKDNRAASLKDYPTQKGFDRDEWPMAMFREGGEGASVRYIDPSDNRGAGSAIGNALRNYDDGTIVKFIIVD